LKILHFLTNINIGGAEKFCIDICNTQVKVSNNEIYLCVLDDIGENQLLVKMVSAKVNLISLNKKSGYYLNIVYKIYQLLSKIKPDIIHLNGRSLVYASIPIILKKIPAIYTVHTMADKEHRKNIKRYSYFLFNFFPKLFTPVAISKSVLETVQRTYGKNFTMMVYNGSSELKATSESVSVSKYIDSLKENKDTLVFMYIGRLAPEKNTLMLVKAFNRLLANGKNVVLLIVGHDPTRMKNYLPQCKMANLYMDKIKFIGPKGNIADYLLCADALCLTSNYEGLGIVALEAFSLGVPVISTPSGGPNELIVSDLNGFVSEEISIDSYLKVLEKFIDNPIRDKIKIIENYRKKYTMDICASQYLDIYKKKYNENRR
jgi:glycosyltransferase involved in cell wall biosynthesis